MRIKLAPVINWAGSLLEAIEAKSWHSACDAAHYCLCCMPSPAWAEETPGAAVYYFDEAEANRALNDLRCNVCVWLSSLASNTRSWEATDDWPQPKRLCQAIEKLTRFVPVEESVLESESVVGT